METWSMIVLGDLCGEVYLKCMLGDTYNKPLLSNILALVNERNDLWHKYLRVNQIAIILLCDHLVWVWTQIGTTWAYPFIRMKLKHNYPLSSTPTTFMNPWSIWVANSGAKPVLQLWWKWEKKLSKFFKFTF